METRINKIVEVSGDEKYIIIELIYKGSEDDGYDELHEMMETYNQDGWGEIISDCTSELIGKIKNILNP